MQTYIVEFWYYTDLRHFQEVKAKSQLAALVIACDSDDLENWCESDGFHVAIRRK